MSAVLALLGRLLGLIEQLLGIAGTISGLTEHAAQEHLPFQVESTVVATSLNVGNPTYGLSALHDDLALVAADVAYIRAHLADPVTLPTVPPTGYGGDTAAQIWGYYNPEVPGAAPTMAKCVADAWRLHLMIDLMCALPLDAAPHFQLDWEGVSGWTYPTDWHGLTYDLTDILPGDTVLSWLTRTDTSGRVWQQDATTGLCYTGTNLSNEYFTRITCRLTDADLQAMRAGYARGTALNVPPVWPGAAAVTLGAPAALSDDLSIVAPMDGVIVNVTTPPNHVGVRMIGGEPYDYSVGEITFATDEGDLEPWQYLGFRQAIFVPKTMVRAAGCRLRALHGAEGTVTPWVVS